MQITDTQLFELYGRLAVQNELLTAEVARLEAEKESAQAEAQQSVEHR